MKTNNAQLSIATGGGTLLSVVGQLGLHDIVRTAVLAAIGATVSFLVSLLLQKVRGRKNKPLKK